MDYEENIDALGLLCPLPVLKLRKRMSKLKKYDVIKIITDDPAAKIDIPFYCIENGHYIIKSSSLGKSINGNEKMAFFIEKREL